MYRVIFISICIVVVGAILTPFFLSLLVEEVRLFLKTYLSDYYLYALVGMLGICILILSFIHFHDKANTKNVIAQEDPNLREQLIQKLTELYKARFKEKMKGELRLDINLKLKYTTIGTSPERTEKFFLIKEEEQIGDFEDLFKDYIGKIKRLLILGEPGAGKSILMLRFGLKLIEEAKKDVNFPIPIILDLVTWKQDHQTFELWLEQNLPYIGGSFAISKEESRELVESNSILILLDGFDEIQEQYRNSCMEKLHVFLSKLRNSRKETLPEVILCSRISEYLSADDAPVFASIEIQPLQPIDVQSALTPLINQNDEPAIELQNALNKNPFLYTAITSAFFLHILLNIYTQEKNQNFTHELKELLQKEIIETYIQLELKKLINFPIEKIKKWIGWMAWKMKYISGTVSFELADIQPQWTKRKYSYNVMCGLVCGGIAPGFGIIIFIFDLVTLGIGHLSLSTGTLHSITVFLFISLAMGLIGFCLSFLSSTITTKEILKLDFTLKRLSHFFKTKIFRRYLLKAYFASFIVAIILGTIYVNFMSPEERIDQRYPWIYYLLIFTAISGTFFGLIYSLIEAFFKEETFPKINNPYKRLTSQFLGDIFKWQLIAFIGLMAFVSPSDPSSIISSIIFFVFVSIFMSPIFKHICLRLALFTERLVPLRLVSFLNLVSRNTGLLINTGGQWRFRHQLIHDSFANWFNKNHSDQLRRIEI